MTVFACRLSDADLVRGCAPEQPEEIRVGQQWMRCSDGNVLPVKRVTAAFVHLGGDYLTVALQVSALRRDWVCIDMPDNVAMLHG